MKKKGLPLTRSQNMARIKSKNTKPEIYIRKLLYKAGYRYRVNHKELPGTPDIYISKYRTAIFVNGCFWHHHKGCKIATTPKTNSEFWKQKFKRNSERDVRIYEELFNMRVSVIIIWECEIREIQKNEEYRNMYLKTLYNRIENIFSYCEESIPEHMEIAESTEDFEY